MDDGAALFGLGRLRWAPRVMAGLAALPVAYALHRLGGFPLFVVGLVVCVGLSWIFIRRKLAAAGTAGDGEIVADQFCGQLLAFAPLSLGLWLAGAAPHMFPWPGWVGSLIIFRALIELRPPPLDRLGRLGGEAGRMTDDLAAGAIAALLVTAMAAISHGWIS